MADPTLQPRKDYDDYLRFVKDLVPKDAQESIDSTEELPKPPKTPAPAMTRTMSTISPPTMEKPTFAAPKNRTMSNFRPGREMRTLNPFSTAKKSLMEAKLEQHSYKNSVEYSKIFPSENEVRSMVIPIAGYAGHRRGDRSQNFFGKPFRETSFQARKLQREMRIKRTFNKEH